MRGHRTAELRSLALHRLVVERITADPTVIDRARTKVCDWLSGDRVARPYAERWLELLDGDRAALLALLVADTQEARDLRQVTPFAGVVPERERWRIVREVS